MRRSERAKNSAACPPTRMNIYVFRTKKSFFLLRQNGKNLSSSGRPLAQNEKTRPCCAFLAATTTNQEFHERLVRNIYKRHNNRRYVYNNNNDEEEGITKATILNDKVRQQQGLAVVKSWSRHMQPTTNFNRKSLCRNL